MCGRFAQFNPIDVLKARFDIETVTCEARPSYNIAPSREVLAVIDHDGLRLGKLKWGMTPFHSGEGRKPMMITNARAETLSEKRTFKEALKHRRCLIMADGFYEWEKEGKAKIPYYFYMPDKRPFAFAGLWSNEKKPDGTSAGACAIITREAAGVVSWIHNRMPVIVPEEMIREWLMPEPDGANAHDRILMADSVTELACHRVSAAVNNTAFDDPVCIRIIEAG